MFLLATLVPILPLASSTSVLNLNLASQSLPSHQNLILPSSLSYSALPDVKPEFRNLKSLPDQFNSSLKLNDSLPMSNVDTIARDHDDRNFTSANEIDQTLENTIAIVVPILFSLIFIIGLFGNALVVIVVTMNASMRSTTNLLILNLAIADLLFIVFCVPFTASDYYFTHWQFGQIWCKTVQYLILVLACASNYTLVLMSLDRYLAVVHPIGSMSIRTAKNAYIAIILIWLFITIACLPAIQLHTIVKYHNIEKTTSCTFNSTISITHTQFQLGFCVSSYVIPLLIAFALYFLMLKKLWFGSSTVSSQSRLNNLRCRKRVTRMVIIVVLTFAFCWSPIQIILVLKSLNLYHTDQPVYIVIQIASQVLAYTNSCINPILYAFLSENFRKAFHKVIACNLVGIYGVNQASMMQTGQTSMPQQSAYLTPMRTNSKRNLNRQLTTDLDNNNNNNNNDEKDQLPDIIESANRNLKSVNFSIVADGGLFPKNSQTDLNELSKCARSPTIESGETTTLINRNDKQIRPILNQSKNRFKSSAKCLEEEDDLENDAELNESKMELHPTEDFIPMYEYKSVPSTNFNSNTDSIAVKESTNDTMNKSVNSVNNCTNCSNNSNSNNNSTTTMTMLNNAKGVFL